MIIDANNSPAVWSTNVIQNLSAQDIIDAQDFGIEVRSGGNLTISLNGTTTIDRTIEVMTGGELNLERGSNPLFILEVLGSVIVDGVLNATNSNVEIKGTDVVGGTFNLTSTCSLTSTNSNFTIFTNPTFEIDANAQVDATFGKFHSFSSQQNIIEGDLDLDKTSLIIENDVIFKNNGNLISSDNVIDCKGEVTFEDFYLFSSSNADIDFKEDFTLGTNNSLYMSNGTNLQLPNNTSIADIRGDIILNNSTTVLKASIVDLYGNVSVTNSTFCLRQILTMYENSSFIADRCTLEFFQNAIIKMSSNCSTIFSAYECEFKPLNIGETWQGIRTDFSSCNALPSQFLQAPQIDGNGNCTDTEWAGILNPQTSLIELTDCSFENAEIALDVNGILSNQRGAAVCRIRETTFTNCEKGISIKDYKNSNNDPNASYIMTCDFVTDDNYPTTFSKQALTHIELVRLKESGVNIGGCIFTNNMTTTELNDERGTGISVIESKLSLSRDGDRCRFVEGDECPDNGFADPNQSRRNEFHNLSYGVKVDQNGKDDYAIGIRFSDFNDCYRGIDVSNAEQIAINENTLKITQIDYASFFTTPNPPDRNFIRLDECGGYTVAECTLETVFNNASTDEMTYILASNVNGLPKYNSKIKLNTFTNNATGIANGIVLQDHTRGNDITCNTFKDLTTDIWVKGSPSMDHLEAIPKSDNIQPWNNHSEDNLSGGNPNWVTNINTQISFNLHWQVVLPKYLGPVNDVSHPSADPQCVFICEDNENTTTASDETSSINRLSVNHNLWIYEMDVNTIAFGSSQKTVFDICIYNLFGQCGVQLENIHSQTSIDVSGLSSGVYFVSLKDIKGIETTLKFIKK